MTILLHGFWGQPQDWNQVLAHLPLSEPVLAPDLYEPGLPIALPEWSDHFWRWVDQTIGCEPVQLVGYSMGGRLALNAILRQPIRVRRALLLSASPLPAAPEREGWEENWARAFREKSWPELEQTWQEQALFAGAEPVPRRRTAALREPLAESLTAWSPRRYNFTPEIIRARTATIDWAFGATDQKYVGVVKTLQELPVQGQISVLAEKGHRLHVEAAEFVSQWIQARSESCQTFLSN